jgi:hypothetical protein
MKMWPHPYHLLPPSGGVKEGPTRRWVQQYGAGELII